MKFLYYFNFARRLLPLENQLYRYSTPSIITNQQALQDEIVYIKTIELNLKYLSQSLLKHENVEKLESVLNEINDALNKNRYCPEYINTEQLQILFSQNSRSQRTKYLKFLFKKEKGQQIDRRKKEEKKSIRFNRPESFGCDFTKYGIGHKTLLLNVRRPSKNKFYNRRMANSVLFGNKIVIDLDYDNYMVEKETASCVNQMRHIYSTNRQNHSPFDLYFCNAKSNYKCVKYLKRDIPTINESLFSLHEESYLDLFSKESLVYLSPHADESLKFFDPSAVYIIGGFVDTVKKEKISLNKASIEGIKSYSLPLDEYILWKTGSKSLTINQVFEIMLILKNTGNWKKALGAVPIRKIQKLPDEEVPIKSHNDF